MTKENNQVVSDVENVVGSIKKNLQQGKNVEMEDIDKLVLSINYLIADYKTTIENLVNYNSLVVKFEKFIEVIGMIEDACVDDSKLLDQTTNSLLDLYRINKQK